MNKTMIGMAWLVVLVYLFPVPAPVQGAEKSGQVIGAAAVWNPSESDLVELENDCKELSAGKVGECLLRFMKRSGASEEALAFCELIGNKGYMWAFREAGRVDVAYVEYPFRVKGKKVYLLVNGFPPVIDVDDQSALLVASLRSDPLYAQMAAQFPEIGIWPGDRSKEDLPIEDSSSKSVQRFIVDYRLLNGCQSCELLGKALFAFDFDGLGQFVGIQLLAVESLREKSVQEEGSEQKVEDKPLQAMQGQKFSLTLDSNPTTGYHWELAEPLDESVVKFVDKEYKPPKSKLLGAGGQEVWTFQAVGKGKAIIRLQYVRPWEKGVPPEETAEFVVEVN